MNVIAMIEKNRSKVNPHYDLKIDEAIKIRDMSQGIFNLICNAFVFGYAQGVKAQKKRGALK